MSVAPAEVQVYPTCYLQAMPKSGLHLYALMLAALMEEVWPGRNWIGTTDWHLEVRNRDKLARLFSAMPRGTYIKGHAAHDPEIVWLLKRRGIASVFVYRDLRDVAVSQAFHVLSDDDTLKHPGKEAYQALGSFEEVLIAVIEGLEDWPGLFERWPLYAGWLNEPWVLKARFEDARSATSRRRVAGLLVGYLYGMAATASGIGPVQMDARAYHGLVDGCLKAARRRDLSPTFRSGRRGGWREHFTPRAVDCFKAHDTENWLVTLGYAENKDWKL